MEECIDSMFHGREVLAIEGKDKHGLFGHDGFYDWWWRIGDLKIFEVSTGFTKLFGSRILIFTRKINEEDIGRCHFLIKQFP